MTAGHREGRQLRGNDMEIERTFRRQCHGPLEHSGVPAQAPGHLGAGPEVGAPGRCQPAIHLRQAATGPDRRQDLGQPGIGRASIVHVSGSDHADSGAAGQFEEGIVVLIVGWLVMTGQLDHDVLAAEHFDQ